LVLIEEAGLAHVADPGAGSGAVEALTDALAEAAWEHFRAIETEGGLLAAVRSGSVQRAIAATASARSEQVRRLARPITGTSEFPNLAEPPIVAASVSPTAGPGPVAREESVTKLAMARLAEPFETLRERAEKMDRPAVFLASVGRKAEFAEIATAAANFFGVAGIKTIEEAVGDGSRLAETFRQAGTPLACLCAGAKGTDAAVAAAQTLKAAGAGHIYFIGTGGDTRDRLKAAGVDRFIGDGIDAAELLGEALDTLRGGRRG
jgi:methylmalonyl-CoA mutase